MQHHCLPYLQLEQVISAGVPVELMYLDHSLCPQPAPRWGQASHRTQLYGQGIVVIVQRARLEGKHPWAAWGHGKHQGDAAMAAGPHVPHMLISKDNYKLHWVLLTSQISRDNSESCSATPVLFFPAFPVQKHRWVREMWVFAGWQLVPGSVSTLAS